MAARILVTGSRDWVDFERIHDELHAAGDELGFDAVLVSGACPTGADAFAEILWAGMGGKVERHPADWDKHGRRAGFLRNNHMVELGADVCLAFVLNNSRGASMTVKLAEDAGIPVRRFDVASRPAI